MRLTGGLFATARFGTGVSSTAGANTGGAAPSNLMGGADYVLTAARETWIILGGSLGAPFLQSQTLRVPEYAFAGAMWNVHEHLSNTVPLRFGASFEMARGRWGIRLHAEPVLLFPVDRDGAFPGYYPTHVDATNAKVELLFQHALEVQFGHSLGVGLRYQGVANTFGGLRKVVGEDHYQGAFEPFVIVNRNMGFVRLGFLKTIDEDTASPYQEAWGMRFSGGIHLD